MFLHPSVHIELARQRHHELLSAAEPRRIAKASADRKATRGSGDAVEVTRLLSAADHFGHRETDDIVVDLFWSRRVGDEFRVEVEDRREHVRFFLYPTTGKEAIAAFYHPLAVARSALHEETETA